jgi:hypothetical protein
MRRWGDEFVLHHSLSNDTYRLDLHGGLVLAVLTIADTPLTPLAVAALVGNGLDEATVEEALASLAEHGFVTPC